MGEEWEQDPHSASGQPNQDEIDKRLEDIKRKVTKGANEAQTRIKRVFNKAGIIGRAHRPLPLPASLAVSRSSVFVNSRIPGVMKTGVWHVIWARIWMRFPGAQMKFGN